MIYYKWRTRSEQEPWHYTAKPNEQEATKSIASLVEGYVVNGFGLELVCPIPEWEYNERNN